MSNTLKSLALAKLAKEAIDVQDACNLLAVVNGMSRAIKTLRETLLCDWADVDAHPITRLWADKVAHLTGLQSDGRIMKLSAAYVEVYKLVAGVTGDHSETCSECDHKL